MFKLIKRLKAKEWALVFVGVLFIVAQIYLDLKMPDYMNKITQISQTGEGEMSAIWINGAYMLLCALGSMACSIVTSWFFVGIAADFSARMRESLYCKVQSFSMAEINKFSTPSLITRSTNDVQQLQMFLVMGLQMLIKAPVTAIWGITKIANKEWQWTAAVGIAVAVIVMGIIAILLLVYKKFPVMQKLTDDLNRTTRENLSGIRVIRAYNAENYQQEKFESVNEDFTNTNLYTGKRMAFLSPLMTGVMNGIGLAIYWMGAFIINAASLPEAGVLFADMVVFMSYGMQIIGAFMMMTMIFMIAPRAFVSAKRINEVLETPTSIEDGAGVGDTELKGTIEFRGVSFRYSDASEYVVSDIDFTAKKGQTVALIGSTGCGKSTVVNLASRFYDATEGEVLIDGHNVKEYTKEELSKKIGYVSQKAVLFSGDIRSNIDFGDNDADEQAVRNAVDVSQSAEFVEKQEGGLSGHVAQNGSNFSGGQKQRLSIARALARDAEIYIFDDTFSALDYKTDRRLRSEIKRQMRDATLLIVAQRIGTIKDADLILVLEDGKIAGRGTHDELMENCSVYQQIARSQLSEEELKNA